MDGAMGSNNVGFSPYKLVTGTALAQTKNIYAWYVCMYIYNLNMYIYKYINIYV